MNPQDFAPSCRGQPPLGEDSGGDRAGSGSGLSGGKALDDPNEGTSPLIPQASLHSVAAVPRQAHPGSADLLRLHLGSGSVALRFPCTVEFSHFLDHRTESIKEAG